jgi:hypothetical protein
MKVSRRQFLKTLAAGTFAVASGIGFGDVFEAAQIAPPDSPWRIDFRTKRIYYQGMKESQYSILEFHRWLMEQWDDAQLMSEPVPSTRQTDHIITLERGWRIAQDTAEHLCNGSIHEKEHGNIWSGIVAVGNPPPGSEIMIFADDRKIIECKALTGEPGNQFSAIVPVAAGNKFIVDKIRCRTKNVHYKGVNYGEYDIKIQNAPLGVHPFAVFV